jgi:ABC-type multidrug transport system fused ATPase/permease subunit
MEAMLAALPTLISRYSFVWAALIATLATLYARKAGYIDDINSPDGYVTIAALFFASMLAIMLMRSIGSWFLGAISRVGTNWRRQAESVRNLQTLYHTQKKILLYLKFHARTRFQAPMTNDDISALCDMHMIELRDVAGNHFYVFEIPDHIWSKIPILPEEHREEHLLKHLPWELPLPSYMNVRHVTVDEVRTSPYYRPGGISREDSQP